MMMSAPEPSLAQAEPPVEATVVADVPTDAPEPPVRWTEVAAAVLIVVLCDLTIYRGHGFAGYALLLAVGPVLLILGSPRRTPSWSLIAVTVMLATVALRLVWCGSWLLVGVGMALVVAVSMTLAGSFPYVLELLFFALQTIRSGWEAALRYLQLGNRRSARISSIPMINVLLPAAALVVFGFLFLAANPDLLKSVSQYLLDWGTILGDWIVRWVERFSAQELLFWFGCAWITLGLLRPWMGARAVDEKPAEPIDGTPQPAPLYKAFRNTLLTVTVLFAVYLAFEFETLWKRDFPDGFYYAGYAHEGAAWLTVALGLATVMLSLVFRGSILRDPRLGRLRMLAWAWSVLNLLLALAVYNRMFIYIDFNGLTPLRMVGLFGISLVVIGFILVVVKIILNRDAVWLIRRHLLALALTVFVFALTPVDWIVVRYNVAQILAGDPKPSVQMVVQPIGPEGVLELLPLLDCRNATIRDGIRALLTEKMDEAEDQAKQCEEDGWTAYQASEQRVLVRLRQVDTDLYHDFRAEEDAKKAFSDYANAWY